MITTPIGHGIRKGETIRVRWPDDRRGPVYRVIAVRANEITLIRSPWWRRIFAAVFQH